MYSQNVLKKVAKNLCLNVLLWPTVVRPTVRTDANGQKVNCRPLSSVEGQQRSGDREHSLSLLGLNQQQYWEAELEIDINLFAKHIQVYDVPFGN